LPSVRHAGRGTDRSRRTRGHPPRLQPATRGPFDLRCLLTETKTSRLVFAESRRHLFGSADPLRVERRIENVRVAGHDTCLARAFHRLPAPPHTQENPRRANPQSRAPAVQSTRVADASGTSGHIPTGANVAGVLDHENEADDDTPRFDDWFWPPSVRHAGRRASGGAGPRGHRGASNPRPVDLSTCAAY
jgi:hypothetical protein